MKTLNYCTFRVVSESRIPDRHNFIIATMWSYQLALQIKNEQMGECWIEEKIAGKWIKMSDKKKQNK